jgi:hypothetical protein
MEFKKGTVESAYIFQNKIKEAFSDSNKLMLMDYITLFQHFTILGDNILYSKDPKIRKEFDSCPDFIKKILEDINSFLMDKLDMFSEFCENRDNNYQIIEEKSSNPDFTVVNIENFINSMRHIYQSSDKIQ